ncbi:MAG: universal stress protein [Pseudopelagicola sp.]|nr:universal stress protein [Pseudopelagicola sp.]
MPKTILATTDLSARSDRALHRALRLARANDASLTVMHIVDDAIPDAMAQTHRDAVESNLRQLMASMDGGETAKIEVIIGDPITDIIAQVQDTHPDLLVMGVHRVRPFFDTWRETTAQRITRMASCPVLMVKDSADRPYDKVVAATDFSPASTAAIVRAASLAPDATITPLHAFHVPYSGMLAHGPDGRNDLEASFQAEAKADDDRWRATTDLPETCGETLFVTGQPRRALEAHVASSDTNLICAGAHGRVGQGRALLGSTATDLLRAPPCDILIARPA